MSYICLGNLIYVTLHDQPAPSNYPPVCERFGPDDSFNTPISLSHLLQRLDAIATPITAARKVPGLASIDAAPDEAPEDDVVVFAFPVTDATEVLISVAFEQEPTADTLLVSVMSAHCIVLVNV